MTQQRSNARALAVGGAFSLALLLSGCYVPPLWDVGDEINQTHWIEEGVTTKVEVLDKLGEPDRGFADGRSFYYSGSLSAGAWFFAADGHGGGGLIGEEPWTVRILFDENDIVEVLVTSKDTPDELRENERRASEWYARYWGTRNEAASQETEEDAQTSDDGETAATFAALPEPEPELDREPEPEPEATRSKVEAEKYLLDNEEVVRRGLYQYVRKYALIGSHRPYRDFRIYGSKVESVTDETVVVEIPYSTKTNYNPDWHKRRFVMHWQGDDLAFAGHL